MTIDLNDVEPQELFEALKERLQALEYENLKLKELIKQQEKGPHAFFLLDQISRLIDEFDMRHLRGGKG